MLAALKGHEAELVDPQSLKDQQPEVARNETRSIEPEVFVAVGICTHLGCSPTAVPQGSANPSVGEGWPGGYFCPATAPPSTAPAVPTRTSPRRRTWKCRRTAT